MQEISPSLRAVAAFDERGGGPTQDSQGALRVGLSPSPAKRRDMNIGEEQDPIIVPAPLTEPAKTEPAPTPSNPVKTPEKVPA
jgi:hypothetical protein